MTEKTEGTVKQTIKFFRDSAIIMIIFSICSLILSFFNPQLLAGVSTGLFPIAFTELVIECNRSPETDKK
jgi:hypothetical protein